MQEQEDEGGQEKGVGVGEEGESWGHDDTIGVGEWSAMMGVYRRGRRAMMRLG